jgi:hypothetical protein
MRGGWTRAHGWWHCDGASGDVSVLGGMVLRTAENASPVAIESNHTARNLITSSGDPNKQQ